MTELELTAVVVNWETPDLTIRAVAALIGDGVPPHRIVVVDNGSNDGSPARLTDALSGVLLLSLEENIGFGRASNIGARALPGGCYLFVNSDAFVHRAGSVASLVRALEDEDVGLAVPRLLNTDLTLQANVMPPNSPLAELVRASGLSRFVPNAWQPSVGTYWDHASSRRIEAAIGAVLLVRGSTWDSLGGFDEQRFMYSEDLDLFWRAREQGWEAQFAADAEFVHVGGSSAEKRWSGAERAHRVARAEANMVRRHLPGVKGRITVSLMAFGVGARALFHFLARHQQAAAEQKALFRGYLVGLRRSD